MIKPCSIDNTIDYIRRETGQPYDYVSLAMLFIESSIDIYLPYCGNVFHVGYTQTDDTALGNILSFDYLTSSIKLHPDNEIATLINGEQPSISRGFVMTGRGRACFFYGDNCIDPDNMPEDLDDLNHNYTKLPSLTITRQSLLVDMASVDRYLNRHKATASISSTQQLLVENENLKQEIDKLKTQLAELKENPHPALDPEHPKHAPELIQAISAWEAKYLNNEYPHLQHTPAIEAILANQGVKIGRLVSRIAAITNPNKNKD